MRAETASNARPSSENRWAAAFAVLLLLATGPLAAAEWYVLCETGSGQVVVAQEVNRETQVVLMGPLPGPRTATAWLDANCPSRRCNVAGHCLQPGETTQPGAADGGWEVGTLTTVSLGGSTGTRSPASGRPVAVTGPASLSGPGTSDLTPLINTAKAAVAGCSYPAALAAADQMTNFDPDHPWLKANYEKLQRLATRQRTTQQAVWQASSALRAGKLKEAHQFAMSAADTAVSCQTQAVSALVTGIGTAIRQRKTERQLARRRAAAALLPGLLDLARVASGGRAAAGAPVSAAGTAIQPSAPAVGGVDPCSFKIEFQDRTSLVPVCGCPGYVFDMKRFRCAPG